MLDDIRRLLGYEMTVAEWMGLAVLAGTPHVILGVLVTALRPEHVAHVDGFAKILAAGGSVLFWPILLVAELCPS